MDSGLVCVLLIKSIQQNNLMCWWQGRRNGFISRRHMSESGSANRLNQVG